VTEIVFSTPTAKQAGEWQVEMAREIVAQSSSESSLNSITDVERVIEGSVVVIRVPNNTSKQTITSIKDVVSNYLPQSIHVKTD